MDSPPRDGTPGSTFDAARAGPVRASFGRFVLVGGACTALHYLLLVLLVEGFGIRPAMAAGAGFAAGAVLNYELSRRYTFFGRRASLRSFGRFGVVALFGMVLNVSVFEALLRLGMPHYLLAQAVATAVVMVTNFTLYRRWAFRA
ncbi:MAG: GtrA family protein [Burkholderiales bacterium]|nr:GtrA family protein [Burkholderiales bacterium]